MSGPRFLLLSSFLLVLVAAPARAGWPVDGVPIDLTHTGKEPFFAIAGPNGEAVLTWRTYEADYTSIIKVQRVLASGATPWGDAVQILHDRQDQTYPFFVVPDAGQGLIVGYMKPGPAWRMQRVGADGRFLWGSDGIPLPVADSPLTQEQALPLPGGDFLIFAKYGEALLLARYSGETGRPVWPQPAEVVHAATLHRLDPWMNPPLDRDPAGGAVATWLDSRGIFAQRIDGGGQVLWPASGARAKYVTDFDDVSLAGDGAGGAILGWIDGSPRVCHVQRMVDGAPVWGDDGALVEGVHVLGVATDGAHGAWVTTRGRNADGTLGPMLVTHLDAAGRQVGSAAMFGGPFYIGMGTIGDVCWVAELTDPQGFGTILLHVVEADGTLRGGSDGLAMMPGRGFTYRQPPPFSDGRGGVDALYSRGNPAGGSELLLAHAQLAPAGIDLVPPRRGAWPRLARTPQVEAWPSTIRGGGTALRFALPGEERVDLAIASVQGRVVRRLLSGAALAGGIHEVRWDGRGDGGEMLGAGVYFALLRDRAGVTSSRVALLR